MARIIGAGYSPEELERGKRTLHRAELWRYGNPDAWACIERHALELASIGQPISAQSLLESVRKKSFVDRYGNDTKVNNSFAPVFARWLASEHPETRRLIEVRRSVQDALGVPYV